MYVCVFTLGQVLSLRKTQQQDQSCEQSRVCAVLSPAHYFDLHAHMHGSECFMDENEDGVLQRRGRHH